jgi:hypothetical protein
MGTSVANPVALRVWCDDEMLWVELEDCRVLGVPLGLFPRFLHASAEDSERVAMSGQGWSLHWEALDEDISVAGLLAGQMDETRTDVSTARRVARANRPPEWLKTGVQSSCRLMSSI